MKVYVPVQLTQSVEDDEDRPRSLGWKDLTTLRVLDVSRDTSGGVAMELSCANTHVKIIASRKGGVVIYRNNTELVEASG